MDVDRQSYAWLPEDDFVDHFAAEVATNHDAMVTRPDEALDLVITAVHGVPVKA